jgi:hypothetical protein
MDGGGMWGLGRMDEDSYIPTGRWIMSKLSAHQIPSNYLFLIFFHPLMHYKMFQHCLENIVTFFNKNANQHFSRKSSINIFQENIRSNILRNVSSTFRNIFHENVDQHFSEKDQYFVFCLLPPQDGAATQPTTTRLATASSHVGRDPLWHARL